MSNLRILETQEDKIIAEKRQQVKDHLEQWLRMNDIDEIVILGKIGTGSEEYLRTHLPGAHCSRIWWTGALENAKHKLNNDLDNDEEDYIEEEGGEDGE